MAKTKKNELVYAGGGMWFLGICTFLWFLYKETAWCTQGDLCGSGFFKTIWFFVVAFFFLVGIGLFAEGLGFKPKR